MKVFLTISNSNELKKKSNMPQSQWRRFVSPGSLLVAGVALGYGFHVAQDARAAPAAHRVYELRTYTTNSGKLEALNARFRDNTLRLFASIT